VAFGISFGSIYMRGMRRLAHGVLVAVLLVGCGGSMTTAPGNNPPGGGTAGGTGGGTG
jgi:hypothetical protein